MSFAGCSSDVFSKLVGPAGPEGPAPALTALGSGDAHCPSGGTSFTTVAGTTYACNGAPGRSTTDSPAQVLAKVVQVDGSGSGLDADLLDGQHASAFETALVRTVTVHPLSTAGASGTALLQALSSITGASAATPYLLRLEPGIYDVGGAGLDLKAYVTLEGAGERASVIRCGSGCVRATSIPAGAADLRELRIEQTSSNAVALVVSGGALVLRDVTVSASPSSSPSASAQALIADNGAVVTVLDSTLIGVSTVVSGTIGAVTAELKNGASAIIRRSALTSQTAEGTSIALSVHQGCSAEVSESQLSATTAGSNPNPAAILHNTPSTVWIRGSTLAASGVSANGVLMQVDGALVSGANALTLEHVSVKVGGSGANALVLADQRGASTNTAIRVLGSRLGGPVSVQNGLVARFGATQLEGGVTISAASPPYPASTAVCAAAFDANYASLGSNCQ